MLKCNNDKPAVYMGKRQKRMYNNYQNKAQKKGVKLLRFVAFFGVGVNMNTKEREIRTVMRSWYVQK